jgi:hypothetical protein
MYVCMSAAVNPSTVKWLSLNEFHTCALMSVAVGSRTRDRGEAGPALVTKAMSHQGKTYARAERDGVGNVRKSRSLLHLTSKE